MDSQRMNDWRGASYEPDLAAEIDGEAPATSGLDEQLEGAFRIAEWVHGAGKSAQSIGLRHLAYVWSIFPALTQGAAQLKWAERLGVERAAISYWVKKFEAEFGVHTRGMKSVHACESYLARRMRNVKADRAAGARDQERRAELLKRTRATTPAVPTSTAKQEAFL